MVISQALVRAVARAVEKGLHTATLVPWLPCRAPTTISIRLPVAAGSRITPAGIARRLLVAIGLEKLTRFMPLALPGPPALARAYRASTRRFSVRAYQEYDLYKDTMVIWFDVVGSRG